MQRCSGRFASLRCDHLFFSLMPMCGHAQALVRMWYEIGPPWRSFAGEPGKYHHGFNAGAMVLTPSTAAFDKLCERGRRAPPFIFGNIVDCTEQALLNDVFFENSRFSRRIFPGRPVLFILPPRPCNSARYMLVGTAEACLVRVRVLLVRSRPDSRIKKPPSYVHYIKDTCKKPWSEFFQVCSTACQSAARTVV